MGWGGAPAPPLGGVESCTSGSRGRVAVRACVAMNGADDCFWGCRRWLRAGGGGGRGEQRAELSRLRRGAREAGNSKTTGSIGEVSRKEAQGQKHSTGIRDHD